ncbi:MAG TPA: hypothetical protein VI873_04700 [Candidatus Peribacteraceae bacterium]|nr:hypothetical protein [Candidatus Peribacteraceae bacterium]
MEFKNDHGLDRDALWEIPGARDIEQMQLRVGDIVVESLGPKLVHFCELRGHVERGDFSLALRGDFASSPELARGSPDMRATYINSLSTMKLVQAGRDFSRLSIEDVSAMMAHIQKATQLELLWLKMYDESPVPASPRKKRRPNII